MTTEVKAGDLVELLGVPDWLTHDMSKADQREIHACVGNTSIVEKIDMYGYVWVGFGTTSDEGDDSVYSGNSFCVPKEFVRVLPHQVSSTGSPEHGAP